MDYNVLVLAAMLGNNNPEGRDFSTNVSFYIDYALNLLNAGANFVATADQIFALSAEYPTLVSLSLPELLSHS
jgi:hypothetical protein